ncbi:PTS system mannose/fructose/sorbose family transporter subunit IIC [Corallococcus coralloides]|uniref:PTS system mannose/fructose/sorbose family transporter subunit IIC n=1 Tax=Corallococcus coralloides TaxID=184914 RepID=A0A410S2F4_CORCK|nr:PTS sugar transporter subunit IIC [Corallococcus coralloides]QAT88322.1 PTS system mannose/fructose/sorbose family transporter subunit IIC [Corallococcus coralloides]
MNVGWTQVALACLWGGLVAVERKAFLQAMLSRPLVAATFMGALLGDVGGGLSVGMLLELFYLGTANLGASLPENDTLAATGTAAAAATLTAATGAGSTPAIWSLAVLLFIGLGRVGRRLDRLLEGYSARLARVALASAEAGNLNRAMRQNLWGMWPHFASYGAITGACALAGYFLEPLMVALPHGMVRGLAWAYPAMASVAAAIAAQSSHAKRAPLYAGLAAAAVTTAVVLVQLQEQRP